MITEVPEAVGPSVVAMADPNNPRATEFEERVLDAVRTAFPDADVQPNRQYYREDGTEAGEVDILVDGIPVEVTIGRSGKTSQLQNIEELTGEAPILMGERLSGTMERNLRESGITVVRGIDDLIEALRQRGVGN